MNKTKGFKLRFYPELKYGGFTDIDGTIAFFSRVRSIIRPSDIVLDLGCGRGQYSEDLVEFRRTIRILKGTCKSVVGIDVDSAASTNPFVDVFHLINSDSWPLDSDSVDLVVCDNVLEHVQNPSTFLAELRRVLKDGGTFCFRTPNKFSYISLFSMLIPNRLHSRVTRFVQENRRDEDVFPAFYRCNTKRALERNLSALGFNDVVIYHYEAEPSYLEFSSFAYCLGVLHQRFAPRNFRPTIFGFARIQKSEIAL